MHVPCACDWLPVRSLVKLLGCFAGIIFVLIMPLVSDMGPVLSEVTDGKSQRKSPVPVLHVRELHFPLASLAWALAKALVNGSVVRDAT